MFNESEGFQMKGCDGKIFEDAVYQHFKGGLYKVVEVRKGYHDDVAVVLYHSTTDPNQKLHARVSTDFCADVRIGDKIISRFSQVFEHDEVLEAIRLCHVILDFHPNAQTGEGNSYCWSWGDSFRANNLRMFEDDRTHLFKSQTNDALLIECLNNDNIWNPMICLTPDGNPFRQHGEIIQVMNHLRELHAQATKHLVKLHKRQKEQQEK